jgi:UDP-4-amino-4,6-dideoxy-N-acetyl-beta-L-altrosamine transaminase
MIPYGRQTITADDISAVVKVLESDFITQGPQVPAFEKALCEQTSASYAVAVNNATSALHMACQALGLQPGDRLWTSPITFVASANCGRYCGATIDFVDIDPLTYTLCPQALAAKLIEAKNNNCLPKIVIPVHLAGHACDMQAIYALSKEYGFSIIEDASHAVGAKYQDKPVGACQYSDITVFSFHPVKIITTGEGGVALTNQPDLAGKMALFRSHGITRNAELMHSQPDGPWYYEQLTLGHNYRLTDIQAALGISQLSRLEQIVGERRRLAARYQSLLSSLPIILPLEPAAVLSSYHLYIIRLNIAEIRLSHKVVFEQLLAAGIGVNLHYMPVYKQPYYQALGFERNYCPVAEHYYQTAISLPLFPGLSTEEQDYVVSTLTTILKE